MRSARLPSRCKSSRHETRSDGTASPPRIRPRPLSGKCVTYVWAGQHQSVPSQLAIYLRDHHAAARAGIAIAKRAAASSVTGSSPLSEVAAKIEEDFRSLEDIMQRLAIEPSRAKDAVATIGEKLGRLKLNGGIVRRRPLSDVLELETLVVGITGKQALWESMRFAPSVPSAELDSLNERAEQQKSIVEESRRSAAQHMVTTDDGALTAPGDRS